MGTAGTADPAGLVRRATAAVAKVPVLHMEIVKGPTT